ncbi:acyl-CoA thioesterase [Bradyrhizobium sp. USDA 4502]
MELHPFDEATRLTWNDGFWLGHTSMKYWGFIGPYGGITAATMLRAIMDHPNRRGEPLSMTVNMCDRIAEGPFRIDARAVRTTRSTQHWIVELFQSEGEPLATATAVCVVRQEGWSHTVAKMAAAPAPELLRPYLSQSEPPPPNWVKQYDLRFAGPDPELRDEPHAAPKSAMSVLWMRDLEPRPIDYTSIMSMSDAFFARLFHMLGVLVPFGTVTMTTNFHMPLAELEGTSWILGIADANSFRSGYGDQTAQLWSRDGRLVASGTQATYYRKL